MYRFYFPPGERDCAFPDYSSTPAFVNLGRYVTQYQRCSADLGAKLVDKGDTSRARVWWPFVEK
jgi:hypothetical protein